MVSLVQMMQPLMEVKIPLDRSSGKNTLRRSDGKKMKLVRNY